MPIEGSDSRTDDDPMYYSRPPSREGKELIAVKCTLEAYDLSKVDTVNGRAYVKIGVIARWYDQRMIGRREVPDKLWGPYVRLSNELDIRVTQVVFDIEDSATGLMKRLLIYTGLVKNSMTLSDFPVDISFVELIFRTSSDYMTCDFKRSGARATGQTYQLWWPDDAAQRIRVRWPGDVHEWELIGISTELVRRATFAPRRAGRASRCARRQRMPTRRLARGFAGDPALRCARPAHPQLSSRVWCRPPACLPAVPAARSCQIHHAVNARQAYTPTTLGVFFHVKRMYSYYLLKALLPLWLTFGLSLAVFAYEPEHLEDRIEIVLNCFLAVISLLFVISTFLPVTSTLTIIDYVTLATLTTLGCECVACIIVGERMRGWAGLFGSAPAGAYDHARMVALDTIHFRCVCAFYVGANLRLLVPAIRRHNQLIDTTFRKYKPPHPPRDAGRHKHSTDLRFSYLAEPSGADAEARLAHFREIEGLRHLNRPDDAAKLAEKLVEYKLVDKDLNDLKIEITACEVNKMRAGEGLRSLFTVHHCNDSHWHQHGSRQTHADSQTPPPCQSPPRTQRSGSSSPTPSWPRAGGSDGLSLERGGDEQMAFARPARAGGGSSVRSQPASEPRDESELAPSRPASLLTNDGDRAPLLAASHSGYGSGSVDPPLSPRRELAPRWPSTRATRGPDRLMTKAEKKSALAYLEAEQDPNSARNRGVSSRSPLL
jgi:hypothetical protein